MCIATAPAMSLLTVAHTWPEVVLTVTATVPVAVGSPPPTSFAPLTEAVNEAVAASAVPADKASAPPTTCETDHPHPPPSHHHRKPPPPTTPPYHSPQHLHTSTRFSSYCLKKI